MNFNKLKLKEIMAEFDEKLIQRFTNLSTIILTTRGVNEKEWKNASEIIEFVLKSGKFNDVEVILAINLINVLLMKEYKKNFQEESG